MNLSTFNYYNITTQTTAAVQTKKGWLHSIVINTPLANGVVTVYDSLSGSGTKIATITSPGTLLTNGPITAIYDVSFGIGLTVVTSGANQDVTVNWT